MELHLVGMITTEIEGVVYRIVNRPGSYIIYNNKSLEGQPFETLPKAISHLRSIYNGLKERKRAEKPKNDSLAIKKMHVNDVVYFSEALVTLVRPLLVYYRKNRNRDFKTSFEYIEGNRMFKVLRIK